jgi:hypothetical protein
MATHSLSLPLSPFPSLSLAYSQSILVPLPEVKEIPKIFLLLTLSLHEDALLVHLSPQRESEK